MKQITGLLVIVVFAISCNSKKTDLEEQNIKGKVWKIQQTTFSGEGKIGSYKIGDKSNYGNRLYFYDDKGNLLETQTLDERGNPELISKYIYNNDDVCTEINSYREDKLVGKTENKLEAGKVVEVKSFNEYFKGERTYEYEYSGKKLSSGKILDEKGKVVSTFNNKFSNGLLNSQTNYDSPGKMSLIVKYKWNEKDDMIELTTLYPKDTSEYKTTYDYEYDKKGNWIKEFQLDEDEIDNIIIRNISYTDDVKNVKSGDITGMWFVVDENDWIEFRKDKKYDSGYKEEINESGLWEIDKKQQILTFRANNPDDSRKYKYAFEGSQMVLSTIQGDEEMRLEKR